MMKNKELMPYNISSDCFDPDDKQNGQFYIVCFPKDFQETKDNTNMLFGILNRNSDAINIHHQMFLLKENGEKVPIDGKISCIF